MRFSNFIIIICLSVLLTNCGDTNVSQQSGLSLKINAKSLMLGDTLNISLNNPKQLNITDVSYQLDDKVMSNSLVLNSVTLGKKTITAVVKYSSRIDTITKSITIYNNSMPAYYSFEVVNTYPHDITSYTQGLEFYNGVLYESTGQYKESKLRKVNFETGEVIKNIDLADNFFGEGLTILDDKLYQLTWRAKRGFVYDVNTFDKISTFNYGSSKEGWGICNDGELFYKSDGTEKIWFINPKTMTETGYIEVYTEKGKIPQLNELEWIEGKLFANIYQRNGVVIINPETGGVEGVIDFKPLKDLVTQHPELDVLNGIAYNPERKTIFVTGKNWDKLFEVTIKKK